MKNKLSQIIGFAYDILLTNFPNTVRIETTNACNSKCIICPRKTMTRQIKTMNFELYKYIVDECSQNKLNTLHLHNFGEPLLDNNIYEKINYAKQMGIKRVKIFSNGSLLSNESASKLIDAGLDEIKISFDGATPDEFERIRYPLKFDRVIKNIMNLIEMRNKMKSHLKITVAVSSTSDKNSTMRLLENSVDNFSFGKLHNWADSEEYIKINTNKSFMLRKPCSRVWQTFTILSDGNVALCCLDYDGSVILGKIEIEKTTIKDIWKNNVYKNIRKLHKNAKQYNIPICYKCTKSFI